MSNSLNEKSNKYFEQIAKETLAEFENIAGIAEEIIREDQTLGSDVFASINTLTASSATQNINKITQERHKSYQILTKEPAIARILAAGEDGKEKTYYICRTSSGSKFPNLASYRSPVGRLASLDIGEELTLPNKSVLEVLEKTILRPIKNSAEWDSRDSIVETESFGPFTIESLRALLRKNVRKDKDFDENILSQLLAKESNKTNIKEGIRRNVITKMGLRDQPILDQYQDEIFRLPLNKRLLLLGPPGTGKTTTLIRRLGQKLDTFILEESEQKLIESISDSHGVAHANSWLMFTPTELLKQYLKEAFARENVPAPDQRIRTWQDYRRELARNVFGILKTTSGSGTFILKDQLLNLSSLAKDSPIQWFEDFNAWQYEVYIQDLLDAATSLKDAKNTEVQNIGLHIQKILSSSGKGTLTSIFGALAIEAPKVQDLVIKLKEVSDKKIDANLNLQLNLNRSFLDELVKLIDELQQIQTSDIDEQEEFDEEEESAVPRTGVQAAVNAYRQAVRAQARATVNKRTVSKESRNGKIIEWLGGRGLKKNDYYEVGSNLLLQASARRFVNPLKRYFDGLPKRYRSFRRERQDTKRWYLVGDFEIRDIHPLELDIILLAILRAANALINQSNVQRNIDAPAWSALRPILELYRNQILVDEATDFSPIQLAAMASLTHPRIRSFFACGDFNQRLTTWGARSIDDLKWVFKDIDIREITVSYRQSKQLNELANAMIQAIDGTERNVSLPSYMDNTGFAPALLENSPSVESTINWLANRIREIENYVELLPSVAIFVNSENEVTLVADALNKALTEHNIQVIACRDGQAVGQESSVRVFDIQHIKGLEFEAVFFIDVDQLANLHPELFDKYLYVGTTRAATYLGMTCQGSLPVSIESLRSHFCEGWN